MLKKIQLILSFFFLILISVYSVKSLAASSSLRFQHLTIDDGLPQNSIVTIAQDSTGFLWFGTEDGLARYDGYSFKIFKHEEGNPNSLSYNYISSIVEDNQGVLWIGTGGGGLNSFDTQTEQFTRYQYQENNINSLSNDSIHTIVKDSQGNLWIGTFGGGLNYFNTQTKQFTRYRHQENNPDSLSHDLVYSVIEAEHGDLWVGTANGLNYFDRASGLFSHYRYQEDNPSSIADGEVHSLVKSSNNNLWVGTRGGGLSYLDTQTKQFTRYQHQPDNINSLSHNTVYSLLEDSKGDLWIGTGDGGLSHFDQQQKQFTHYRHQSNDPNSLSHDTIFSLLEDNLGNIWIGSLGGGVNYINSNTQNFGYYRGKANNVFSLLEDSQGDFWVGTRGNGLKHFNTTSKKLTHYLYQQEGSNNFSHSSVYALEEDGQGNLWIGTASSGLIYFDKKTAQFTHYQHQAGNVNSLIHNTIFSIVEDEHDNLWIGTPSGISYFNIKNQQFTHYRYHADNPNSLTNNTTHIIKIDHQGNLWIGTAYGLEYYNVASGKFTHYHAQAGNANSLSYNTIYALLEDRHNNIWIGTGGGGLNHLNPKTGQFTHYNIKDGLPNNVIYAIEEDDQGYIWVSTNRGLSRMDPTTGNFVNYDLGGGLQSNEFNIGASFKGKSGALFFGGINGFNRFFPAAIKDDVQPLTVVITDMLLLNNSVPIVANHAKGDDGNKSFSLKQAIQSTKAITLSHRENVMAFEFTALHFSNPKKNKFAYQLVGWDSDWVETDYKNRRATYTNLPAGDYIFRVKASNANGTWDEDNGTSLKITVLPAPWRTWWAYMLYTLAFAYLVSVFIRSQRKQLLFEQRLNTQLENKVMQRTIELQSANEYLEQANSRLEELSSTDQLTGLRNRRFLLNNLPSDIEQVLRNYHNALCDAKDVKLIKSDIIFFLIDLDHFKKINDIYGHSAGDAVLIQIKAILESVFRETDYLVRWGGEEFLVAARFTDRGKAPELAERLRSAVEEHAFDLKQEHSIKKTCSIGYACFPFSTDDPSFLSWERVIDIADHCLYAAKRSGRNAWVGLENLTLTDEHAFVKASEETQAAIDLEQLKVMSSIADKSLIQWD